MNKVLFDSVRVHEYNIPCYFMRCDYHGRLIHIFTATRTGGDKLWRETMMLDYDVGLILQDNVDVINMCELLKGRN